MGMNFGSKDEIRRWIWKMMEERKIAKFPGAFGRIPNFVGAEKACRRLDNISAWRKAKVVKINPDSPQKEARYMALSNGKTLIMPSPKLRQGFIILDPTRIPREKFREASTIRGAFKYGKIVDLSEIPNIDLIVVGSVCVDKKGWRIGKGGGYAELEYAILKESGRIHKDTPVITIIHDMQFVDFEVPHNEYDLGVDIVITPTKTVRIENAFKPHGILWEKISEEIIREIPILNEIRQIKMQK